MTKPVMQVKDVIEKLTGQHKEVLLVIKDFVAILDGVGTMDKAIMAKSFLDKLESLLDAHLKIEDQLLYPILKKAPNPKLQNTAIAFSKEMVNISGAFSLYIEKWSAPISIADKSKDFIKETIDIVAVLYERIDKEDNKLFPLLISTP